MGNAITAPVKAFSLPTMHSRPPKTLSILPRLLSLVALAALSCVLPTPAQAEPRQIEFTLSSQGSQDFETMMQQAESVVDTLIQQSFAEDSTVTEVSVMILGEHNGQQAPLLSSKVSRADWQQKPRVQVWTQYFRSAAVLLGFVKPQQPTRIAAPLPTFDPIATSMTDREQNFYQ